MKAAQQAELAQFFATPLWASILAELKVKKPVEPKTIDQPFVAAQAAFLRFGYEHAIDTILEMPTVPPTDAPEPPADEIMERLTTPKH